MSNALTPEKSINATSAFSRFMKLARDLIALVLPKPLTAECTPEKELVSPGAAAKAGQVVQTAAASPPSAAPALTPAAVAPLRTLAVTASTRVLAAGTRPMLRLGQINARIAPLQVSAEGLAQLGFPAAGRDRAAVLFHEEQFPAICEAIVGHIHAVLEAQAA